MDWKTKLHKLLENLKYKEDIIGVLACGSYITGNPTSHSDLDVHIILKDSCDYRVRMNKYIDGLLIECFLNPPEQIRTYFKKDYNDIEQSSMNQFATGQIIRDDTGIVSKLKQEAKQLIDKHFKDANITISELDKYNVWDMLDDLQDALKQKNKDFNFIYYNNLNKLLKLIFKLLKYPYGIKNIYKAQFDNITKFKYSLRDFPNPEVSKLIIRAITTRSNKAKVNAFELLSKFLWQETGDFSIDTFEFKSKLDI